jgi:hypothetical protein
MFTEIEFVKSEYQLRNAKFNNKKEVEGYTVQVPNILDRAVMALRNALTGRHAAKPASLNRRAAMAK